MHDYDGDDMDASRVIDKQIAKHPDWRGERMAEIRRIIHETVPDVTEEVKWMGTPTWSHNGILCICNPFKDFVKVTFYNGAQLKMDKLFNAELEGNKWRAIKIYEGDEVNAAGLKKLLLAAVKLNSSKAKPAVKKAKRAATSKR
jgi:hypothetical protein